MLVSEEQFNVEHDAQLEFSLRRLGLPLGYSLIHARSLSGRYHGRVRLWQADIRHVVAFRLRCAKPHMPATSANCCRSTAMSLAVF